MALGMRCSRTASRSIGARTPIRALSKPSLDRSHMTAELSVSSRIPKPVKRAATRLQSRRVDSPILPPTLQLGRERQEVLDLYSYLLRNRIVFLGGFVDFEMSTRIVGSILALDALDEEEDIKIYINSPGGSIYTVLGVVDVMRATRANVSTVAFGVTGGNASLILAAGTKGKRYAMPSSRIVLQQPGGYIYGNSVEANITATELNRSLQVITHLYSEYTGQSVEQMEMECDRENFLSPEEAIELGIIDAVV